MNVSPSMRQRPAFGLASAYSGHSIAVMACHEMSATGYEKECSGENIEFVGIVA
jgi:hypothetical protein